MLNLFVPGNRTLILSGVALFLAMVLQGDAQGIFTLSPMLKLTATFALTLVVPLLPVFIRKAISSTQKKRK